MDLYKDFEKASQGSGSVYVAAASARDLASLNLRSFDDWMDFKGGLTVDRNRKQNVVKLRLGKAYFLKRFTDPPMKDFLPGGIVGAAPPSHAVREVLAARALEGAGIKTYSIAAFGEAESGLRRRSFLVTEELEGFIPLSGILAGLQGPGDARRARELIVPLLANAATAMHCAGIAHPDFYSTHIFVSEGWDEIRVIDLHRCRIRRSLSLFDAVRDLTALNLTCRSPYISTCDRLRFLKLYYHRDSVDKTVRRMAAKIEKRSARLVHRSKFRAFMEASEQ
jgi:hypothetical protein